MNIKIALKGKERKQKLRGFSPPAKYSMENVVIQVVNKV
jgi:hypothetical protein